MSETSTTSFDPAAIEQWALAYLDRLSDGGRRGVLLGGSIARCQQWKYSDLEAGLLVDSSDPSIPYFNVDSERGVEIIQLVAPDLTKQLEAVEGGDLNGLTQWPIQMFKARVISDPSGLLTRFVNAFDRYLFSPAAVQLKIDQYVTRATEKLEKARALLAANRPLGALCEVRNAMNDVVLALHWSLGELPRSHNRVASRLLDLTSRHGQPEFYALFREVYELDSADEVIRNDWPLVRERVHELASLWRARAFFEKAVDGSFSWGENSSIIAVHRLFVPILGGPEAGIFNLLDVSAWATANPALVRFLGLASATNEVVGQLADRVDLALIQTKTRRVLIG